MIETLPTTVKNKSLNENKPATGRADLIKWIGVAVVLIAGAVGGFFIAAEDIGYQVILWLVVLGIAGGLAALTTVGKELFQFFKDARLEIRKVVWPTRQETMQAVLMVLVAVVVMSLLLWVIDRVIFSLISFVTT